MASPVMVIAATRLVSVAPAPKEVRTARVAIAGAAVAAGRVYRDPQPARVDRQQPAGGDIADVGVVEAGAVVDGDRLCPIADRGEAGPDPQAAQRPGRRKLRRGDPGHRLIEHNDRD